jgi:hypothetical protein
MKAKSMSALAGVLLGVLVGSVRAADVPVTYTVDGTALKAAVSGTPLTFTLYTDAACTTLVHTQAVNVEDVTVISKLKRVKPGGAPTKPPKTDDLRTTLTSVTPAAPLYLKVTGTGITPVGGACQAQAAGGLGATGPATGFVVKDSTGATLGIFDPGAFPGAFRNVGGTVVVAPADVNGFTQGFLYILYYTSSDCSGTALGPVDPSLAKIGTVIGTTLYFTPSSGPTTTFNSLLEKNGTYTSQALCDATFGAGSSTFVAPEGCCFVASNTTQMGPVGTEDLSAFVPPFHLE